MRKSLLYRITLVAIALAPAVAMAADSYVFDTVHSDIGFSVRHMGLSSVRGEFNDFTGTVAIDLENLTASSVEVAIEAASIDTDNEQRDGHLRSPDFLDVDNHSTITFKSRRIESQGGGEYSVIGDLTIRGTTREVELPVVLAGPIDDPRGGKRLGVEGELTIDRQEWGVNFSRLMDNGGLLVGNDVKIGINVEAVHRPE